MSEWITREDVERIAETVSEGLPAHKVFASRRNGYLALDLFNVDGVMVDMLTAGTKREVYTYLQGMRRAQLLARG